MKLCFLVIKLWIITSTVVFAAEYQPKIENVILITEESPPYNMRKDEQNKTNEYEIVGVSADIVKELFKRGNITYSLAMYPWGRAYKTVKENANHGLFSTALTPERKPQFKWVGPIVPDSWVLMGKSDRHFNIKTVADACKYIIGGYRGDVVAAFLEKNGCKIHYTSYAYQNVLKIQLGRIDLWATGKLTGPYLAKREKVHGVVPVFELNKAPMYLALNKSFPDSFILKLNHLLLDMEKDGTVENIYSKYLDF